MPREVTPEFPTAVSIWTGANTVQPATNPRVTTMGQLLLPYLFQEIGSIGTPWSTKGSLLLLPEGTDIRGTETSGPVDVVQIPDGTGNWYFVSTVNDRWLGFEGSHICAYVLARAQVAPRPTILARPTVVPIIPTPLRSPFAI
jgi:hypothetical protein